MRLERDSEHRFYPGALFPVRYPPRRLRPSESTCNRCGMRFNADTTRYQRYWTPPGYLGGPCDDCRRLACIYDWTPFGAQVTAAGWPFTIGCFRPAGPSQADVLARVRLPDVGTRFRTCSADHFTLPEDA